MNLSNEQINAVLQKAAADLMAANPFICTVDQGCLVVQLNWKDTTFFNGRGITREAFGYRYIVKLKPNGKFTTVDLTTADVQSVGLNGINISSSAFAGKQVSFHKDIQLGRDNLTGQTGVITNSFNSRDIQVPVKQYFLNQGFEYQFYSLGDNWHAIPPMLRIALGGIFTFVVVFFAALFGALIAEGAFTLEADELWVIPVLVAMAGIFGGMAIFSLITGIKDKLNEDKGRRAA
jgi:hypothetical protein